jgi:CubicO group peptidase (beta-lactamase class C family)
VAAAAAAWVSSLIAAANADFVPSLQWQVAYGNLTISSGAWGLASVSPAVNATTETLYRIASVSKTFASLLLYKLATSGLVGLDDRVVEHIPEFAVFDPFEGSNGSTITLRHLASHMAGLGRTTPPNITTLQQGLQALRTQGGMIHPAGMVAQYRCVQARLSNRR